MSLVWPAAAVAVIWLLTTWRHGLRDRAIHLVTLAVVTFGMNLATGAPLPLSVWFGVVNVVLAVVTVRILMYGRDEAVLRDPADLARLVAAVAIGTCCAAALATAFLAATMETRVWMTFALFAVRNGASVLVGVSIWLRLRDVTWKWPRITVATTVEALVVGAGIGAVFGWIFWLNTGLPMAFLTLVPAMWLALRYSTAVNTVFLTVAGIWIIWATLMDKGVFIGDDAQERALLAQAMVCSITLIVLALSLYRDSRARLITQLEAARDRADQDSELLGAVLDSIHDSVIVVDPAGEVVLQNARAADSGLVRDVVSASPPPAPDGAAATSRRSAPRDVLARDARIIELTTAPLARQAALNVMAFRDVTQERTIAQALREARDLFAGVLQAASEQAIIGTDPSGHITVFNNGAERLLGWTQSEMLGRTPMDFHYDPEVRARATELGIPIGFEVFVHNVTPDNAEVREWTYVRRDGTHVTVSLAVSQMTREDGTCAGYIGVATDITERKAAEQALAESEERFRLAFDTAPMGMFMFDVTAQPPGRITRCNKAMADILGHSTAEMLTMTIADLSTDESDTGTVALTNLPALAIGQPFEGETAFRRADGTTVWGAVSASIVAPPGSAPYGICLVEDITSRKHAEAELQHLALHDQLTGLANRALFADRLEEALADDGHGNHGGAGLIFLDLDGFKAVNDTWGHAQGDQVLKEVASRIQPVIRPRDTAARLGGDEFAVLCPGVSDVAQLREVAERIRAELRRPVRLADGEMYDQLSVSAGAVTSQPGCTAEALLQRADKLMYRAKRIGKDRVTADDPSDDADNVRRSS